MPRPPPTRKARPAVRREVDGEAPAEGADDVEPVARPLPRQDLRPLPGDPEEELDAARVRVVDAEGAAEKGGAPFGDLDHDELARPGVPADRRGVDREAEMIAPALDLAEAGVALDGHGGSGARFAP